MYFVSHYNGMEHTLSVENMVAEVTLDNNIEMSKNCPKIAKKFKKSPNLPKLSKIERLSHQLYFSHCAIV